MRSRLGKTALEMAEDDLDELRTLLDECRQDLERIVEPEGIDSGLIYLSTDSPCHWDEELNCQVYNHEHFSPLGDALVALWKKMKRLS